ncbi:hypothetical protein [Chitinophaga sp. YIM B06452]|uniref:hypothetical protein n=1 Tax=Chitinophaga sp. YIM B06452 TaxID=3082158 RepID=UPI0031FEAB56
MRRLMHSYHSVYINLNTANDPVITSLSYTDLATGIYIRFVAFANTIRFYSNIEAGTFTDAGAKVQQYRYILISGGTTARRANVIDWTNYAAVKGYLGLKN